VVLKDHDCFTLQVIAKRLIESKQNTPHLYLSAGSDSLWSTLYCYVEKYTVFNVDLFISKIFMMFIRCCIGSSSFS
jgi:hypothetical protein